MKLKKSYLEQVLAPSKKVKNCDGEVKDCNQNLTKPAIKKK